MSKIEKALKELSSLWDFYARIQRRNVDQDRGGNLRQPAHITPPDKQESHGSRPSSDSSSTH